MMLIFFIVVYLNIVNKSKPILRIGSRVVVDIVTRSGNIIQHITFSTKCVRWTLLIIVKYNK